MCHIHSASLAVQVIQACFKLQPLQTNPFFRTKLARNNICVSEYVVKILTAYSLEIKHIIVNYSERDHYIMAIRCKKFKQSLASQYWLDKPGVRAIQNDKARLRSAKKKETESEASTTCAGAMKKGEKKETTTHCRGPSAFQPSASQILNQLWKRIVEWEVGWEPKNTWLSRFEEGLGQAQKENMRRADNPTRLQGSHDSQFYYTASPEEVQDWFLTAYDLMLKVSFEVKFFKIKVSKGSPVQVGRLAESVVQKRQLSLRHVTAFSSPNPKARVFVTVGWLVFSAMTERKAAQREKVGFEQKGKCCMAQSVKAIVKVIILTHCKEEPMRYHHTKPSTLTKETLAHLHMTPVFATGMAQDEGKKERLWNFLNNPLEVPPALTTSGNNGFRRNELEDRTSYVPDTDLDDTTFWSQTLDPLLASWLRETSSSTTSPMMRDTSYSFWFNPLSSEPQFPVDHRPDKVPSSPWSMHEHPPATSPLPNTRQTAHLTSQPQSNQMCAPKEAFNIFSGASGASIPLSNRATLPSGSVCPTEGQLAQANSATWASHNPTGRTLPVFPPLQSLTDAAKASRSIAREVKNNMLKKLDEDIITSVKEQNNKFTDIAKNHDVKVEKVKNMVIVYTHYTKALEINPSLSPGEREDLIELQNMATKDKQDLSEEQKEELLQRVADNCIHKATSMQSSNATAARDIMCTADSMIKETRRNVIHLLFYAANVWS
ncbi:hypothetical protein SERLA73DRAFT_149144 [Serpula lacrymans var. lacrymans S7.3]|uniref:Uncharacterized protein n=1 Tax=Serpula lacrymans var. lacrymans (strain S7.3) TaxID=936435 RepID=F8PFU0_SERL3|nr:hypothetical protein SERLA73DRAFT_149144 [Serpula lacrymans var. lacrymans S7.3]